MFLYPGERRGGTDKPHSWFLFRALCCHENNYLGIQHFRTFVLDFVPHNPGGCGVFEGWWEWEQVTQPTSLELFHRGVRAKGEELLMFWRLKDAPARELGQKHLPEGNLLPENALSQVPLRSGWVQGCQAAAVGSHRGTDSWADEKLSHLCKKIQIIAHIMYQWPNVLIRLVTFSTF